MDKSLHEKENFSSKFSPIHSTTGDDTVIVNAEQRFREESLESEDIVSECQRWVEPCKLYLHPTEKKESTTIDGLQKPADFCGEQ